MAVCTIARARLVIGPGIFVAGIAASSASFQRKTTLCLAGAAVGAFCRQLGATHSSSPVLASDLRKERRLGRDPAWLEASRSPSFTFALSIIAFSFLCSFPFAYLTASLNRGFGPIHPLLPTRKGNSTPTLCEVARCTRASL